jgi:hypothetical protein
VGSRRSTKDSLPVRVERPEDSSVQEVVRISAYSEPPRQFPVNWAGWAEVKRRDGARDRIRTLLRALPRNGGKGRLLICPDCQIPRRGLYGWNWDDRTLRASCDQPGGARNAIAYATRQRVGGLVHDERGALANLIESLCGPIRSDRPEPWLPYVLNSPEEAAEAGLFTD